MENRIYPLDNIELEIEEVENFIEGVAKIQFEYITQLMPDFPDTISLIVTLAFYVNNLDGQISFTARDTYSFNLYPQEQIDPDAIYYCSDWVLNHLQTAIDERYTGPGRIKLEMPSYESLLDLLLETVANCLKAR